jgi:hypothetical protein
MADVDTDQLIEAGDKLNAAMAAYTEFYPSVRHPSYRHLQHSLKQFVRALQTAQASTPDISGSDSAEHALAILDYPVFIAGAGKSGTTLLRHLLDGHPQLMVFPPEGTLFVLLQRWAELSYEERRDGVLSNSLEQLVAYNLGGGPNWLLSAGHSDVRPYLNLVAAYRQRLEQLPRADASLVRAMVHAYFIAGQVPTGKTQQVVHWVEKTPANIYYLDQILTTFPRAKFIFCIRDPRGITASAKFRYLKKYDGFDFQWTVEEIRKRWALMIRAAERHGPDVCLTVRYEDVAQDTAGAMERVAGFLGIRFDEAMLSPTMADLPASQNTAFEQRLSRATVSSASIDRWKTALTQAEIAYVSAYVHPYTRRFGYDVGSTALPGYLRAASRLRRDYRAEGHNFSLRRAISAWVSR